MAGGNIEPEESFLYTPKELNSERFYQDREISYSDLHNYGKQCDSIIARKQISHMKHLCKIIIKYLEESAQWKENDSENEYDECILLNYWLHDKLSKAFVHEKSYINIAYGNIETIWANLVNDRRETSYHNKCKPLYNKILKYDDWKKGKELYDYCINYKYIEQMCQFQYENCGEYCEYVEKRSYLYDYFEKACATKESYCPHFYDKCKGYNPNIVLKTLKCPAKIKTPRAAAPEASAMHHRAEQEEEFVSGAIGSETSDIGTKVGHSVLGVAPVLLTATALYRYTPIGSWIRNLSGNTTNNISGMDGGEIEGFFSSSHESGNMLFDDTQNYISYQPI
ncbi:PIR Superfamily Protein [Plasmodium ovale wallikeri]|uniref:PIR Superfamily Protein n=1 Tax=Plasmodium ovale wallikeri TaxID=864142 RepID=A0A1A9AQN3_PLAOA|nr:PIR Superfamily Protein [Plasmodium ovale wallikeri]SBT58432.1 PIR Superfamily Protein [Plasmodium ovale wallikeri]